MNGHEYMNGATYALRSVITEPIFEVRAGSAVALVYASSEEGSRGYRVAIVRKDGPAGGFPEHLAHSCFTGVELLDVSRTLTVIREWLASHDHDADPLMLR